MNNGEYLERVLLQKNLSRQNVKKRVSPCLLLNQLGQPIAQYTIHGMVFELISMSKNTDPRTDRSEALANKYTLRDLRAYPWPATE